MSHPLEVWKQYYDISDNAHLDLLIILQQVYGIDTTLDPSITATNYVSGPPEVSAQAELLAQSSMALLEPVPGLQHFRSEDYLLHCDGRIDSGTSLEAIIACPGDAQYRNTEDTAAGEQPPCARCWLRKQKCRDRNNSICAGCQELHIPASLCSRVRLTETSVFVKWQQFPYEKKLAWENLVMDVPIYTVDLQHLPCGPTLSVDCSPFEIANSDQIRLFHKTTQGWASMETTAFALSKPIDDAAMDDYVQKHVDLFLNQAKGGSTWLDTVLKHASNYLQDDLIQRTLRLWSAHRLLMQGWQLTFPGSLGMPLVMNRGSFLFNTTPAPRVLQNQLDRRLERYCADKEAECLKALSRTLRQKYRREWTATFISAVILLHTRERDIFRLLYWTLDASNTYIWRHPEPARRLIDRSLHASNVLLGHLHFRGDTPEPFMSLEHHTIVPQGSAKERYKWMYEDSVDFSICRLAFNKQPSQHFEQLSMTDFS